MNYQCKCGCDNMFIEKKGNNTGLYCSKCGKWIKWLNKNELRAFEHEQKEKEISKTIDNNLNNVYSNTNININNLNIVNNLNDFIDFLKEEIDRQLALAKAKESLNIEDSIMRNSWAYAYENVKDSLINIINGRRYNECE